MTFDSGTWWLAVLLLGFATGALIYLIKRSLFGRVDKLDELLKLYVRKVKENSLEQARKQATDLGSLQKIVKEQAALRSLHISLD